MSNARNVSKAESRFVNASGDTMSGVLVAPTFYGQLQDPIGNAVTSGAWNNTPTGYASYSMGTSLPYRRISGGNTYQYETSIDIGTDNYSSSGRFHYWDIPTGSSTYMGYFHVEAFVAGWNWTTAAGYRRWTVTAVANSWVVTLREDNAASAFTSFNCYATPQGTTSVRLGFANTVGRNGFTIRVTAPWSVLDGATTVQTNTNPF